MKKIHCPRCSERLNFLGTESFRLGKPASEPATEVEIYSCPKCGKLELFVPEAAAECRVQSAECRVQSAECRMQNAECRVQNAECRIK